MESRGWGWCLSSSCPAEANPGRCPAEHLSEREAASCEELFKILSSRAARSDGETRDRRAEGETGRMKKDQEGGRLEGGCVSVVGWRWVRSGGKKKIMKRSVAVELTQVGAGKGNVESKHCGMRSVERLVKTMARGAARWEVTRGNGGGERRRGRRRRNFKVYIELAVAAPEDLNRMVLALPPWPINVKLSGSGEAIRLGERKTH